MMIKIRRRIPFLLMTSLLFLPAFARAQSQGEVMDGRAEKRIIDVFRPIYFTSGAQLGTPLSGATSDVKFQVSFRSDLARNIGGSGIQLAVGYTQISLWSVYVHSLPFYDHTFIPGLYAWKQFDVKGGAHTLLWGYEHRSNGRDDAFSRSINYLFCTYARRWDWADDESLTLSAALRLGTGYYGDQRTFDIMTRYMGLARLRALWMPKGGRWELSCEALPLLNRSLANVTAEVAWTPFGKRGNPHLFVQYHYGYDEAFRECVTVTGPVIEEDGNVPYDGAAPAAPRQMLRFGLLFSPGSLMR